MSSSYADGRDGNSRVEICQQLFSLYRSECAEFLHSNIIADETWLIIIVWPPNKVSVHGTSSQSFTCKACRVEGIEVLARKLTVAICWDVDGIVYVDFLEPASTLKSECYNTKKTNNQWLSRVQKHKKKILQQDSSVSLTPNTPTQKTIAKLYFTTIPHLPYSPDCTPMWHFLQFKEHLSGHLFDSNETVELTLDWRGKVWNYFILVLRSLLAEVGRTV